MITIRIYEENDALKAGRLIADTYAAFNLGFALPELRQKMLGAFLHAESDDPAHKAAIAAVLRSPICLVAELDGVLAGILRGRRERLASLFVAGEFHGRGVGKRLVEEFEDTSLAQGVKVIRVAATLYAVPFYLKMGYRRSTGIRRGWSFSGYGLPVQPMRKLLKPG